MDFDFFAHDPLSHEELEASLGFLRGAPTLQESANTRTVLVRVSGGEIKVSFLGGIAFGRVGNPDNTDDGVLRAASLLDLAGTKIKALLQRVESKDYLDIAALLGHGISLEQILGAASTLFGPSFSPLIAQKALCYFEGGDLDILDESTRRVLLAHAGRDLDVAVVPRSSARLF